jgi:proteasome accessory factor A
MTAHDRAGELILMACARKLSEQRGNLVRLYKNNTDFRGHSYGCHENYLLPRSLPWGQLAQGIQAFLVARQIFTGAGKFAIEEEDRFLEPRFQISQRSDFFSELQSVDTMQRRPIINTRDEPHANPRLYRRFHVIIGDANMSPFATRLKIGTTALVLEALVREPRKSWPKLLEPLVALREISRDATHRWEVRSQGGAHSTALEIQRAYLAAVKSLCDTSEPWKREVIGDWESVLDDLSSDVMLCRDRLDWVAKKALIGEFQAAQNIEAGDPWLQSLDLEYHRLDMGEGLYYALEQSGAMRGVPDQASALHAVGNPPQTTRALIRGRCIQKFASFVESAQWDHITLKSGNELLKISLLDLFDAGEIARLAAAIDAAQSPEDLRIGKSVS